MRAGNLGRCPAKKLAQAARHARFASRTAVRFKTRDRLFKYVFSPLVGQPLSICIDGTMVFDFWSLVEGHTFNVCMHVHLAVLRRPWPTDRPTSTSNLHSASKRGRNQPTRKPQHTLRKAQRTVARPMPVVQPRFPQGKPGKHVELAAHRVLRKHRPREGDMPLIFPDPDRMRERRRESESGTPRT